MKKILLLLCSTLSLTLFAESNILETTFKKYGWDNLTPNERILIMENAQMHFPNNNDDDNLKKYMFIIFSLKKIQENKLNKLVNQ